MVFHFADGLENPEVRAPQTVTCRIGTEESSATLSSLLHKVGRNAVLDENHGVVYILVAISMQRC